MEELERLKDVINAWGEIPFISVYDGDLSELDERQEDWWIELRDAYDDVEDVFNNIMDIFDKIEKWGRERKKSK